MANEGSTSKTILSSMEDNTRQRKKKQGASNSEQSFDIVDPYDINGPEFNTDMYLTKMLKATPLSDLITTEKEYIKQIQSLDGEMQTLVYENYNKFIHASDTIRKMKFDLIKMEQDMSVVETKMADIKDFSGTVYSTFHEKRNQITSLTGTHSLLKKLQFLFSLPTRLQAYLDKKEYGLAVRSYNKCHKVLDQYLNMASFRGIQAEVNTIMENLTNILRKGIQSKQVTPSQLTEYVELLLQLGEPPEQLCDQFLSQGLSRLTDDLEQLKQQIHFQEKKLKPSGDATEIIAMDMLEFIDMGSNTFLSNISLFLNSYRQMFLQESSSEESKSKQALVDKMNTFVDSLMKEYFELVEKRVKLEPVSGDNTILVRALDRFYRRLQAINCILENNDYLHWATDIINNVVRDRCSHCFHLLKNHFAHFLTNIRHALAMDDKHIPSLQNNLESSCLEQLKFAIHDMQAFVQPDLTFTQKGEFSETFSQKLFREGIVVAFFRHINSVALEHINTVDVSSPALLLVFSKLCLNLESVAIGRMLELVDECFSIGSCSNLTSSAQLTAETKQTAQKVLDHFVKVQGMAMSQMIRQSIETKEWLGCLEPTNVRGVMKHLVEEAAKTDALVGQLFEEGPHSERSSDSGRRRTFPYSRGSSWSVAIPSSFDSNLLSNIQKLFVEKIEIFGSVDFSKISIMTGIIKISLKTLLECVRFQTFTKFGVQQIQVDTHYLHLYMWRFMADENVMHALLDEIVGSTIHRCVDPQLMEPSVVEAICERG